MKKWQKEILDKMNAMEGKKPLMLIPNQRGKSVFYATVNEVKKNEKLSGISVGIIIFDDEPDWEELCKLNPRLRSE